MFQGDTWQLLLRENWHTMEVWFWQDTVVVDSEHSTWGHLSLVFPTAGDERHISKSMADKQKDKSMGTQTGGFRNTKNHNARCGTFSDTFKNFFRPSLVARLVKNPPAVQETWVWSLGQGDPLEKEMATHSSILAWRNPWTEEPGGLQSTGLPRVGRGLGTKPPPSAFQWRASECLTTSSLNKTMCTYIETSWKEVHLKIDTDSLWYYA